MKEFKLVGYHGNGNEIVLNGIKKEQLAAFVREEINHRIWLYEGEQRRWSYEIYYCAIPDPEKGCKVYDDDETVRIHTGKLIRFLDEDFGLIIE